jgi:biotin transporter BioY
MHTAQAIRSADEHEWPILLLATIGGVVLAVGGLWLAVVTGAAWALVLAVILILVGVVAVVTVIAALLDQETPANSS